MIKPLSIYTLLRTIGRGDTVVDEHEIEWVVLAKDWDTAEFLLIRDLGMKWSAAENIRKVDR